MSMKDGEQAAGEGTDAKHVAVINTRPVFSQVVRGPAPLSLALAVRKTQDDVVVFSPWTETDFRDGQPPWWKP